MTRYISGQHEACLHAFAGLFKVLDTDQHDRKVINLAQLSDDFDRFCVWATNLGAAFRGADYKRSLDYRLKEAEAHKQAILKILQRIEALLRELTEAIQGGDEAEDESSSLASDSQGDEQLHADDNDADSSWSLSSDENLDREVLSSPQGQSKPTSLSFQPTVGQSRRTLASSQRSLSKLDILLRSLNFSITALYKVPVRTSNEPRARHLARRYNVDVSYFEPFDISFVRDVFRNADERVLHRLGRSITHRRHLLRTRLLRNQELQRDALNSTQHRSIETVQQSTTRLPDPDLASEPPEDRHEERATGLSTVESTLKATTFKPLGPPNLGGLSYLNPAPSEAAESVSSIATTQAAQDLIIIPPRPVKPDGTEKEDFECPFCCTLVHCRSSHSWKKHVLGDLRPYSCTNLKCEEVDTVFEDRESWYIHELQHLSQYHCGRPEHAMFASGPAFIAHIRENHPELETGQLGTSVLNMFLRPSDGLQKTCPLCLGESRDLKRHLGRHLVRTALFALPRNHGDVADNDAASQGSNMPAAAARMSNIGHEESLTESSDNDFGLGEDRDATHDITRDKMFCHQCQNEWYRIQGSLACPECQSEITEINTQIQYPRGQQDSNGDGSGAATDGTVLVDTEQVPDSDLTTWEQIKPELYVGPVAHDYSTTAQDHRMSDNQQRQGRWNVIVAEQDRIIADNLRTMLRAFDCRIYEVANERSLYDLMRTDTCYHLLLLNDNPPYTFRNPFTKGDVADSEGLVRGSRTSRPASESLPIIAMVDQLQPPPDRVLFDYVIDEPITEFKLNKIMEMFVSGPESRELLGADWAIYHSLRGEDLEGHSKREIEYQNGLHELVTSEDMFINSQLAVLRLLYQTQLEKWDTSTRKTYKQLQQLIFEPAARIEEIHRSYLWSVMFQRVSQFGPFLVGLSDCFVEWLKKAKPAYLEYASNYPWAEFHISNEAEDNPSFQRYLTRCQDHPRSLSWSNFVRAPITRLQRYSLHFQFLLKCLGEVELNDEYNRRVREKEVITDLLEDLRTLVKECDEVSATEQSRIELWRYERQFQFDDDSRTNLHLLDDGRRVVHQGDLQLHRTSLFGARRSNHSHVVLFDNHLVIAGQGMAQTIAGGWRPIYEVSIRPIPIQLLSLQYDTEASPTPPEPVTGAMKDEIVTTLLATQVADKSLHVFGVRDLSTGTTHQLGARSYQQKADWKRAIMELKERYCDGPFIIKPLTYSECGYSPTAKISHLPVQAKGSPLSLAMETHVCAGKQGLGDTTPLKVNCMISMFMDDVFLIGSDDGVYVATSTYRRLLAKQSEVQKIDYVPDLQVVFVLAKTRLHGYSAANFPTLDLFGPANDKSPQLLYEEELLGKNTTDFTIDWSTPSPQCIAIKSGVAGKEVVLIAILEEPLTSSGKRGRFWSRPGPSSRYSVTDRVPVTVQGGLVFVHAAHSTRRVILGTSKAFFSHLSSRSAECHRLPINEEARARTVNCRPLAFFSETPSLPEYSLAVYDDCALYMDVDWGRPTSVVHEFVCKGKAAALVGLYLVIVHEDFLEIRLRATGELAQVIEGCEMRMLNQGNFIFTSRTGESEEMIARLELPGMKRDRRLS